MAKDNQAQADAAADQIETDPVGFLDDIFQLTPSQRLAIHNTGNDELRTRLQPVADALRAGNFQEMQLDMPSDNGASAPDGGPPRNLSFKCDCHIEIK